MDKETLEQAMKLAERKFTETGQYVWKALEDALQDAIWALDRESNAPDSDRSDHG